jgi:pterin-4a-carbinolamine dehydratase
MEAPGDRKEEMRMKTQDKDVAVAKGARPSRGRIERLKPERVQGELAIRETVHRLAVMERLDGLPGWKLAPESRAIRRVRKFADPKDAAAYAAFAVQLAAGRSQPLRIAVSHGQLVVTLHGRSDRGITGSLLDLAAELG